MLRAMLSGGLIGPESNDFGPCFRRTTKMCRRFEVGYDFSSLIGADKVVRDLKPGSEAAKAGIREGDHFTYGVALDAVQADVNRQFTIQVTRDGTTFPITYLPRGEAVEAYQWEVDPAAPAGACHSQPGAAQ